MTDRHPDQLTLANLDRVISLAKAHEPARDAALVETVKRHAEQKQAERLERRLTAARTPEERQARALDALAEHERKWAPGIAAKKARHHRRRR